MNSLSEKILDSEKIKRSGETITAHCVLIITGAVHSTLLIIFTSKRNQK